MKSQPPANLCAIPQPYGAQPARVYLSQSARDAQASGYGSPTYWDELERHALELRDYYRAKGDPTAADRMLSRSLSEALQGNEGA